jgi:ribokinase
MWSKTMSSEILVVGSLNMDLVVRAAHLPQPGETVLGDFFATFPGGKGANQAVAAARMGAAVKMVGCIGADAFGQLLLESLQESGVDTHLVSVVQDAPTGVALISVEASGENTIVVVPGANARLLPADLPRLTPDLDQARVLVVQLETPLDTVSAALNMASRAGVITVLNAAPAQKLPPEILVNLDYLIVNEIELFAVSASAGLSMPAVCQQLLERGVGQVVVTLGAQGVYACSPAGEFQQPAFPVSAVDTTAAGDAFVGAFAAALARGLELSAALSWGNAAGALAVTKAGAQPSLPALLDVKRLLQGEMSP